jgi:hypothetical protein
MGSVRHPRGRLPRRVYWTRRAVVLAVAALLVFGIGKLVGGNGSDPTGSDLQASTSSAQEQEQQPGVSQGPVAPSKAPHAKASPPLLPPSGECRDDEVSVLPSVPQAWGAQPIVIKLGLQSLQAACTFKVSPETLVVKITSGNDRIWSSQDCPKSIPTQDVVVRSGVATNVDVTWNGKRSEAGCPSPTDWALAGFYHVYAAAMGSTPTDVQFEVTRAPTSTVTKTAKPKPSKSASPSVTSTPKAKPKAKPSSSVTVSGKGSKCGGDNAADSC